MKQIELNDYLEVLQACRQSWHDSYYAMYSSLLGGVVRDPLLMQVPLDDHLVHRGDGVFDTFKCVERAAYNLDAHLKRLMRSAAAIGLVWPGGVNEVRSLTLETLKFADRDTCSGRVMISRGPGSFGVSPYDSPEPTLYIVVYAAGTPFMTRNPQGARVRRSQVPVKPARFATVKNCNYLPNVMMKREAVGWEVDFTVGFDEAGLMAEGATENFGIVTREGDLIFPRKETVLDGTTMLRVMQFAEHLVTDGRLRSAEFRDITFADSRAAAEMLIVGTTINVVAVCEFEGAPIGDGKPGKIAQVLNELLLADIETNILLRTTY